MPAGIHLVHGSDPILVADAVRDLVASLVGDGDRTLMVDELDEARYRSGDATEVRALVEAAQTPPFLTDRRVVVGRELALFAGAEALGPLLGYLADPLPTTALVLVWERAPSASRLPPIPKKLEQAVTAAGGTVHRTAPPTGRQASTWIDQQIAQAGVRLDRQARAELEDRLGEDLQRLRGILETVLAVHGAGATVGAADLEPLLGEAGSVPPWELTDAIADGDAAKAIDRLQRMLAAGERHPLQIMAILHGHYERLLRLDGADAATDADAARILGMKGSTFPAKKALQQARRLGGERVARAIDLLATADLDLRGATGQPGASVLEVLVARLARLHRS